MLCQDPAPCNKRAPPTPRARQWTSSRKPSVVKRCLSSSMMTSESASAQRNLIEEIPNEGLQPGAAWHRWHRGCPVCRCHECGVAHCGQLWAAQRLGASRAQRRGSRASRRGGLVFVGVVKGTGATLGKDHERHWSNPRGGLLVFVGVEVLTKRPKMVLRIAGIRCLGTAIGDAIFARHHFCPR